MSADTIVKSFIDRVLRLKEEQDALAADIREVYAEAKGNGYDKTAMGAVVAHLRKIEKHGADALEERDAAFGLYLDAYERASGTAIATHTHEASAAGSSRGRIAEFDSADAGSNPAPVTIDPETGGLTDTQEQPETATQSQGVQEARSMPAESMGDEISERVGLAGPACAHDDETANTKPAPNSLSAETPPAADKPETAVTPLPVVSGDVPEGIPAFLLKERKPLRPNCLHPDNCAGYGSHTCHSCTRAMAESEVAA